MVIWKFSLSHTKRKSYTCALTYVLCLGMRPHKSRTHTFVSNSAENGPAMAGPAGLVPAPMWRRCFRRWAASILMWRCFMCLWRAFRFTTGWNLPFWEPQISDELALHQVYWRYCSLLYQLLYFIFYQNPTDSSPIGWTLSELSIR